MHLWFQICKCPMLEIQCHHNSTTQSYIQGVKASMPWLRIRWGTGGNFFIHSFFFVKYGQNNSSEVPFLSNMKSLIHNCCRCLKKHLSDFVLIDEGGAENESLIENVPKDLLTTVVFPSTHDWIHARKPLSGGMAVRLKVSFFKVQF